MIAYAINQLAVTDPPLDRWLELFVDDPESVDQMLEEVMKDKAAHRLNQHFGKGTTQI